MNISSWFSALIIGILLTLQTTVATATSLNLVPSTQTVNLGDAVSIDVVISGLDAAVPPEVVSAFDLDVSYDSMVLTPTATPVAFGSLLGDPGLFEAETDFSVSTPGVIDFAELSLLPDSDLSNLQSDTFTLATLSFTASDLGTSPLSFEPDSVFGIDVKGLDAAVLTLDVSGGSVEVVPIPGAVWLMGSALVGIFGLGFRRCET